jgi:hypothetical protein
MVFGALVGGERADRGELVLAQADTEPLIERHFNVRGVANDASPEGGVTCWLRRLSATRSVARDRRFPCGVRWWVRVAPSMPIAAAMSRRIA